MSLTPIPVAGEPRAAVGVQQVVLRCRGGSVPDHGLRPRLLPPDLPPGRGAGTAALVMGLGVPGLPVPLCPGDGATRGSAVPPTPARPPGAASFPRAGPTRGAWGPHGTKRGRGGCFGGAQDPSCRPAASRVGGKHGGKETTGGEPMGCLVLGLGSSALRCGNSVWKERAGAVPGGAGSLKSS